MLTNITVTSKTLYDSVERIIAETFVVFIHVEKRTEKNLKNAGKTI